MRNFNAQDLANTAWSFAETGESDASLFEALAKSVQRYAGNFNTPKLANTGRAFAKMGQSDARLFGVSARTAECCVDD